MLQDLWAAKAELPELLKTETGGVRVQYQPVWQATYKHLDEAEVKSAYAKAGRRFIFTDFGGTLMEKEKVDLYIKRSFTQTTGKKPSPSVMEALRILSSDPKNEVYVISGLQLLPLEDVFGQLDRIGLAAGNGLYLSMPQLGEEGGEGGREVHGASSAPPGSHVKEGEGGGVQQRKGKKRSWSLLDYGVKWAQVSFNACPLPPSLPLSLPPSLPQQRIWHRFGATHTYPQPSLPPFLPPSLPPLTGQGHCPSYP